jgi:polysaccharide pyruvyl transferase WcaK-like protein
MVRESRRQATAIKFRCVNGPKPMGMEGVDRATQGSDTDASQKVPSTLACKAGYESLGPHPRIALLTPYNGGNLGDAAIQDAMIANLRLRLPGAQFSGVSLNCENFLERHGVGAFPLCGVDRQFYGMLHGKISDHPEYGENSAGGAVRKRPHAAIKRFCKRVPPLWFCLKMIQACWRELRHWVHGYRFLCTQDVLVVSGGGQLNEEGGGAWCHPFALFKWTFLARVARIPHVVVSVGVGKVRSTTSRLFFSAALRTARYRSYRDEYSRTFAKGLLRTASRDPVVPDLALSLPMSEIPQPRGIRAMAEGRPIIAISPICFAKPQRWPTKDQDYELYQRYVGQMARVVSQLLGRGHYLVFVWSSLWDDESAIPDLLGRLDDQSKRRFVAQTHIAAIATWKDLVASLLDVDILIASRLHSVILGVVSHKPTVAISFDPKVDRIMEDLGQTAYLLNIHDFHADDVIKALESVVLRKEFVMQQMASYLNQIVPVSERQYDVLAALATKSCRNGDGVGARKGERRWCA